MTLRLLSLIVAVSLCTYTYAQTPTLNWAAALDGDNSRGAYAVTSDNSGNSYVVGSFFGTMDADPGAGVFNLAGGDHHSGYIIKLGPTGGLIWAKHIASSEYSNAVSVAVDAIGNVYFTGSFINVVDLDPAAGVFEIDGGSTGGSYYVKLSASGDFVDGGALTSDEAVGVTSIGVTDGGDIYMGGLFLGTFDSDPGSNEHLLTSAGDYDVFVVKLDSEGDWEFAKQIGGTGSDLLTQMKLDPTTFDIVGYGSYTGSVDFDPSPADATQISSGEADLFVFKLDRNGEYQWAKTIYSNDALFLKSLAVGTDGSIAFTGEFSTEQVDFDPSTSQFQLTAVNNDVFLVKLTSGGSFGFAVGLISLTDEVSGPVAIDNDGNVYLAARFGSDFIIDPGSGAIIYSDRENWDMLMARYSPTGDLTWFQPFATTSVIDPYSMSIDNAGNIYLVGDFVYTANFGTGTCSTGKFSRPEDTIPFVVKYSPGDVACFGFIEEPEEFVFACELGETNFRAPAGGTTNIIYQWQYFNGSVWIDLADEEFDEENNINGVEGSNSPYLTVIPVEGGWIGNLRVRVNGDGVTTLYSSEIEFSIIPKGTVPGIVATSGCGPGTYTLTAVLNDGYDSDFQWEIDGVPVDGEAGYTFTHFFNGNETVTLKKYVQGCTSDGADVIVNTQACAPTPGLVWAKQIGPGLVNPNAMTLDNAGNLVIVGDFYGAANFDPNGGSTILTATGTSDSYIAKYSPDGNLIWALQTDISIYDVAVGVNGDIVYSGSFTGTNIDVDPTAGTSIRTVVNAKDMFIGKLGPTGNFVWGQQLVNGAGQQQQVPWGIAIDNPGNVYITGAFTGTIDFDPSPTSFPLTATAPSSLADIFVAKYTAAGAMAWAKKMGSNGGVERGMDIKVDNSGNVYTVGKFNFTVDFDPNAGVQNRTAVGPDAFIQKLATDGTFAWAFGIGAGSTDEAMSVTLDATGNPIVAGTFTGTVDFDPAAAIVNLSSSTTAKSFIAKYTSAGALTWAKVMGGEVQNIFADNTGNITATGFFENQGDFDPGTAVYEIETAANTDAFVSQISPAGDFNFAYGMNSGGRPFSDNKGIAAVVDGTGNIYATGSFRGSIDADPSHCTSPMMIGGGGGETYIQKVKVGVATICFNKEPVSVTACSFAPVSITAEATGTTNIKYQWQRYVDSVFENVIDGNGYSGATTATLNIQLGVGFGMGTYRVIASGDNASPKESMSVEVGVGSGTPPDAPDAIGDNDCKPGEFVLTASGSTDGNYRWYNVATGGTPDASNFTSEWNTGWITSTFTKYVTIVDGGCESDRTEVYVLLTEMPDAPVVPGKSVCSPGSAILAPANPTTGESYEWFTVETAGTAIGTNNTYTTPALTTTTTYYVSVEEFGCVSVRTPVTVTVTNCGTNKPPVFTSISTVLLPKGTTTIDLKPLISDPDNNLDLTTLKIIVQPKSGATATIDQNGQLIVDYAQSDFIGEDELTIEVCDIVGSCVQQKVFITVVIDGNITVFNAVSPNGDGKNDVFYIGSINLLPKTKSNKVSIYNRWGDLVFEVNDYDNDQLVFKGLNDKGNELPSGTYYYKIVYDGGSESGYLSLKR